MSDEQKGTRIVIRGVRPFDGEYDLDLKRAWTVREWNWIKRFSGYMPATIDDGLKGNDPEVYVALALIAMARNGKIDRDNVDAVADVLMESERGAITIIVEAEEGDASPPDLTLEPDESSPIETSLSNGTSGSPSRESSALSDASPPPTGTIESATPRTSALAK